MRPQITRQGQKTQGDLQRDLVRGHALGERSPLGFFPVLRLLTELHEWPEATGPDVYRKTRLRIAPDGLVCPLPVRDELGCLLRRKIRGREVLGNGDPKGFSVSRRLEEGPEAVLAEPAATNGEALHLYVTVLQSARNRIRPGGLPRRPSKLQNIP